MIVPVVLAFSASYSVNGTVAPVPLGTLNGDWAQYGGVPACANAGAATASVEHSSERGDDGRHERDQPYARSCRGDSAAWRSFPKEHHVHAFLPGEVVRPPLWQGR